LFGNTEKLFVYLEFTGGALWARKGKEAAYNSGPGAQTTSGKTRISMMKEEPCYEQLHQQWLRLHAQPFHPLHRQFLSPPLQERAVLRPGHHPGGHPWDQPHHGGVHRLPELQAEI